MSAISAVTPSIKGVNQLSVSVDNLPPDLAQQVKSGQLTLQQAQVILAQQQSQQTQQTQGPQGPGHHGHGDGAQKFEEAKAAALNQAQGNQKLIDQINAIQSGRGALRALNELMMNADTSGSQSSNVPQVNLLQSVPPAGTGTRLSLSA